MKKMSKLVSKISSATEEASLSGDVTTSEKAQHPATRHSTVKTFTNAHNETPPFANDINGEINEIFERLLVLCTGWKNASKNDVDKWAKDFKRELIEQFQCSGITDIEVARKGVEKIRENGDPFFPTVGQYVKLCLDEQKNEWQQNGDAYKQVDASRLLEKKGDPMVARAALKNLKTLV